MLPHFTLPLPAKDFLDHYWQQQALFMPASASGLDWPDPDTLASLSLDEAVESRLVKGTGEGPWSLLEGPMDELIFAELPEKDWTLLVQSVDHCLTEVSLLLDCFGFLPTWRIEDIMISYAVTGGSVGPHVDRYDVFLLQARGQRHWDIGPSGSGEGRLVPDNPLRLLQQMPVEQSFISKPGDVLYLPPGTAHHGVALDDDCVTWSVGFRAPNPGELLAGITDEILSEEKPRLLADPKRPVPKHPALLDVSEAATMTQAVRELLSDSLCYQTLARSLSTPRQDTLDFSVDCRHIRAAVSDASLVRHGGTRLLLDNENIWVNGQCWPLTPNQRPLAELLASKRLYREDELQPLLTTEAREVLDEWIEQGHFCAIE